MTTPDPQDPTTPCPDWCRMHIDGRHVAELELADTKKDYNIYTRPIDYGGGKTGLELVVAKPDGTQISRVEVDPDKVTETAWLSELNRSLTAFENGTTIPGEDDRA